MNNLLNKCNLCPRNCNANRNDNELGFCNMSNTMVIARSDLHFWEEPPISGVNGSGTIFFSGCSLQCVYCQNYKISRQHVGKEVSIEKFSDLCLDLQKKGALNINLVTPTHFVPLIIEGLKLAKKNGLTLPIVYNTSSYENINTIKLLDGMVDIYLPDLKYYEESLSKKYSNAPQYFEIASNVIKEMYEQVGKPSFNEEGTMIKGVIVRHLVLPDNIDDSKNILKYLYNTYKDDIYISIMNQYTPIRKFIRNSELNNKVSDEEYEEVVDYAIDLGIKNAFIQEGDTQQESFIPDFDSKNF